MTTYSSDGASQFFKNLNKIGSATYYALSLWIAKEMMTRDRISISLERRAKHIQIVM